MKSLLALFVIPMLTIAFKTQSQWGEVYFDNSVPFASPGDRRVRNGWGELFVSTNFIAELYYGTNQGSMVRLSNAPPARFRPEGTSHPGTWAGGMRTLVGIPPGTLTYMQVRMWDNDAGATIEEARRNNGPYLLQSATFTYVPPAPGSPIEAHYIENVAGFSGDCGPAITNVPSILVQPTNQTAKVGDDVVISVVSTNFCDHQWQFNGTNINALPGSRFLVLTNVQQSQAGDYRVIINPGVNPSRGLTSQVARLTVEASQWGEVSFRNTDAFVTPGDRRIRFPDGSLVVGTNFVVQLYYGTSAANLNPVTNPPAPFRNIQPSDGFAGTWSGGRRTLVGFPPGTTATLRVRLWDSDWGRTYEEAQTNGSPFRGQSTTFTYTSPPPGSPATSYYMERFSTFGVGCPQFFGPPAILSQPAHQVAYAGQTVILSARTTNNCMTQWQFNGTNLLSGRFGSLRINDVRLHHQGDYRVIATQYLGGPSATSEVARLTVHPASQLTSVRYNNGAFAFHVSEDAGRAIVIETAPDLKPTTTWTPVSTNTAPFWFTNSTAADRQHFYRTVFR